MLRLRPITIREARAYVDAHHRHNRAPQGAVCAVAVESNGELHGVGILGRPVARGLQNGHTAEITRVCTDGTRNAASKLYGALCRAASALGYDRVVTYTLAQEPGTSLRAAGFREEARLQPRPRWAGIISGTTRPRHQVDLFGQDRRPPEAKVRWVRNLVPTPA